jgi:chromosome segregation ATPase
VDAAAASLPEEDERAARADLGALDDEAEAALGALGGSDETLSPGLPAGLSEGPTRPTRGASADLLRAAGIKLLDDEPGPALAPPPEAEQAEDDRGGAEGRDGADRLRAELSSKDAEIRELRRKLEALTRRADDADAELAQARTRIDAAQEKSRKAEAEARTGREEARRAAEQTRAAESEIAELRRKATDAEKRVAAAEEDLRRKSEEIASAQDAVSRAEALERELDEVRAELLVARGEADGARGEVDRRTADLKKRVTDLEAANAKNEERVVKAYQKIKADEKVREKVRKALAIATQLLEEGLPAESAAEKERRIAAAVGRE